MGCRSARKSAGWSIDTRRPFRFFGRQGDRMTVNRGRRSTGGELLVPAPTFAESLLMEILIHVIHPDTTSDSINRILTRAGFTDEEIQERM